MNQVNGSSASRRLLRRLARRLLVHARDILNDAPSPASGLELGGPPRARPAAAPALAWRDELQSSTSGIWGLIENTDRGLVTGWMFSPREESTPTLLVDGKAARLVSWPLPRPDVKRALKMDQATGFRFELDGAPAGACLELHAFTGLSLEHVHTATLPNASMSMNPLGQLERAAQLARDPACVAITCWDGTHNPVGRAKALYDVARTRGPAVLFCYRFDEFGSGLWPPLKGADIALVQIPWVERDRYHQLMRDMGLSFGTVWLCKPRLPTFMLAAQISSPETRLVLDLDDNEEHFSMSQGSRRRVYGLPGLARVRMLSDEVPARTVASTSLQRDFGGHIVRHVRERPAKVVAGPPREVQRVAFVGTVRAHKNLMAAANAIGMVNWAKSRNIRFHVLGDVAPAELREKLKRNGVVVGGLVPVERLPQRLAGMDCLIAGFPSDDATEAPIVKYQISSKIGDALAVGKPVLVPESDSVRDLVDVPGVYLFDETNFADRLCAALDAEETITLPDAFTPAGAAKSLDRALKEADVSPRAGQVLSTLRTVSEGPPLTRPGRDVLLLIWKQHDAGLYGRRVDQLARTYKRQHPDSDVVVLELLHPSDTSRYAKLTGDFTSDATSILSLSERKSGAGFVDQDGVTYCQIAYATDAHLPGVLQDFLIRNAMLPSNTRLVLFPILAQFAGYAHMLAEYPTIVDVVDNQFSWAKDANRRREYAWQYSVMLKGASRILFNSVANCDFFVSQRFLERDDPRVAVIPNWYLPPGRWPEGDEWSGRRSRPTMVYTGNMSDRVDWGLLTELSTRLPDSQLLLVGGAARAGEAFEDVVTRPNVVYLGPLSETESLRVLAGADVAVVPHVSDQVSTFMNPLKVRMYEAVGLPTVVTDIPGVELENELLVKASRDKFVDEVERLLLGEVERTSTDRGAERSLRHRPADLPEEARRYLQVLDGVGEGRRR